MAETNGERMILVGTEAQDVERGYTFDLRFELAFGLIKTFGIVAADQDRETDEKGRAKYRLQTPEHVVKRSMEIAGLFVDECIDRGWVVPGEQASIGDMARLKGRAASARYKAERRAIKEEEELEKLDA